MTDAPDPRTRTGQHEFDLQQQAMRIRKDTVPIEVTKELLDNSHLLLEEAAADKQRQSLEISRLRRELTALHQMIEDRDTRIISMADEMQALQECPLTGLLSRRLFEFSCNKDLLQSKRRAFLRDSEDGKLRALSSVAFMVFDLDHFSWVNNTHGHLVGDKVLKDIASLLRHSYRDHDIWGRWGGEEFTIYLPFCPTRLAVLRTLDVRKRLARLQFGPEDARFSVTTSVGVSYLKSPDDTLEDLFGRADKALYYAKEHGRDQIVVEHDGKFIPITDEAQLETTPLP